MPELIIYVIAIIVACAAIYYLSNGLPQPWNWVARAVAIVLILFWLGRILRIWAVPLLVIWLLSFRLLA